MFTDVVELGRTYHATHEDRNVLAVVKERIAPNNQGGNGEAKFIARILFSPEQADVSLPLAAIIKPAKKTEIVNACIDAGMPHSGEIKRYLESVGVTIPLSSIGAYISYRNHGRRAASRAATANGAAFTVNDIRAWDAFVSSIGGADRVEAFLAFIEAVRG